jgi:lysozyme family protein
MADFNLAIDEVLIQEGGYVNDPADHGGETKYGISKRSFPQVDIPSLTIEEAKSLYRETYWRFESVESQMVANKLLSMAVNFGLSPAVRLLQNILRVNSDGIFGPRTLTATNSMYTDLLLTELRIACAVYYAKIVSRDTSQIKFINGWMRRALS